MRRERDVDTTGSTRRFTKLFVFMFVLFVFVRCVDVCLFCVCSDHKPTVSCREQEALLLGFAFVKGSNFVFGDARHCYVRLSTVPKHR